MLGYYYDGDLSVPKKRKSGGRSGGKRGRSKLVQCHSCGQLVAQDKAKKFTVFTSAVDYRLAKELRDEGAIIPRVSKIAYYCVSCAIHRHRIHIRKKSDRKGKER